MITERSAEQWSAPITGHGEGPTFDPVAERLLVLDMLRGDVVELDADGTEAARRHHDVVVTLTRRRRDGSLLTAGERGVTIVEANSAPSRFDLPVPDGCRLNEGELHPDGSLWIGSMAYDQRPGGGSLWRLDLTTGAVEAVLPRVGISNGLAFSDDGARGYYVDSHEPVVQVLALDESGRLASRSVHVDLSAESGAPDGLALAPDGSVYVAMFGGGNVLRVDPAGAVVERITVPVAQVTACTLDPTGTALFITTSDYGVAAEDRSSHGSVFRTTVGPSTPRTGTEDGG